MKIEPLDQVEPKDKISPLCLCDSIAGSESRRNTHIATFKNPRLIDAEAIFTEEGPSRVPRERTKQMSMQGRTNKQRLALVKRVILICVGFAHLKIVF